MLSKYKIFMFHFKNNLKTMQSVLLLLFFAIATFSTITFLHNIKTQTNSNQSMVCIETQNKVLKKFTSKCNDKSKKVNLDISHKNLIIQSSNYDLANISKEIITNSFINLLGRNNILPFERIKIKIIKVENEANSFPIYSLMIFYIMLFSGMLIVSSIAIEKINKLRLMTQFKLSSDFLIFTKIFAVFLQLAILIGLSLGTILYFNSIKYIDLSNFKEIFEIKTDLWLTIYLHLTNLIISYYVISLIGSSIKTQEEIQNKAFFANLIFMFAFGISMVFSLFDHNIQNIIKHLPIISSFVLDKVTDIKSWIIIPLQIIVLVITIWGTSKKFKEV